MSNEDRLKCIVADDEDHIRLLIKSLLQSLSFSVVGEATNGKEAVELVAERAPDLVLLDVNMPQMSGIEALTEIKRLDSDPCVIMLTSVADMDTVQQCISAGAANYIRKDTPLPEMKALILETLKSYAEQG